MELEQLQQQLQQLDRGQVEILRRLDHMGEDLKNTMIEIGGVPDQIGRDPRRPSLRVRLHKVENDQADAALRTEVLQAARTLHEGAAEKRFSRREKILALAFAAVVAIGPYLAPFIHPG